MTNDPQSPLPGEEPDAGGLPETPAASPSAQPPQAPPPPSGYSTPGAPPPPPYGSYPQAPHMGGMPSRAGQPADLGVRFLARLIDYVILLVVNLVLVTIVIVGALMGDASNVGGLGGGGFAAAAVSSLVGAVIYVGYFAYFESSRGQTVGKMVLKLKTVGPDGNNPTMEQAVKRNAWAGLGILGIIPVVGGVLGGLLELAAVIYIAVTINNNTPTHQGWHDQFAGGTRVIRVG